MTLQENSRKKRKKGLWLQGLKWTENSRQGSWSTDNIGSSYDPGSFPQEGQHTNILLSSELEIAEEEICRWDFPSPKFFFFLPYKILKPPEPHRSLFPQRNLCPSLFKQKTICSWKGPASFLLFSRSCHQYWSFSVDSDICPLTKTIMIAKSLQFGTIWELPIYRSNGFIPQNHYT